MNRNTTPPPSLAGAGDSNDPDALHRESFFRQSGWLMFANISAGVMMWAVHLLNKFIPPGQYGNFGALLAVVMLVPAIPLQMILAQQTANALATDRRPQLAGLIRWLFLVALALWAVAAVGVALFQNAILERWHMDSAAGIWITMVIVLLSLWMPMLWGALQGKQNFLWLGWSMMSNGIGRITLAAFIVLVLHAYATGMMVGVLCGMVVAGVIGAWCTRDLWGIKPAPFELALLLRQVVPLFAGFLGFQILFTSDTLFVKAYFSAPDPNLPDFYVSAGTLSRALMWLVLPLAAVMFPRIVHSAAKAQKSNLMNLVLLGTFVLAVLGAVSMVMLGPWVVRWIYKPESVPVVTSLLPWYVSAMVPLALANVLLNNLLAKPESKLVPALVILALAAGYLFALTRFHGSMETVLKTMGVFNLLLLGVCAFFTWGAREKTQ